MNDLVVAMTELLASISEDNGRHGGLYTRKTIRLSDECRVVLSRIEAARKAGAALADQSGGAGPSIGG